MKTAYFSEKKDSLAALRIDSSYYGKDKEAGIFVLAEGLGEGQGRDMAGYLTVRYIVDYLLPEVMSRQETDLIETLKAAMKDASKKLAGYAVRNPTYQGMASKAASAIVLDGKVYCGGVGDVSCFLLNSGKEERLTEEHEGPGWAIGYAAEVEVGLASKSLEKEDVLLLCGKGLSDSLGAGEISKTVLEAESLDAACKALAAKAGGENKVSMMIAGELI